MPSYSAKSQSRLDTCTDNLRRVFGIVIQSWDNSIFYGHRPKEEQDAAVAEGKSQKPWPTSKHNSVPSQAVDAGPYYPEAPAGGIDWRTDAALLEAAKAGRYDDVKEILENIKRWHSFGGFVRGVGAALGIKIRWGGDWSGDNRFNDQKLIDLPHFEEE